MSPGYLSRSALLRSCLRRGLFLAVLWWALSGGRLQSWVIGAPTIVLGVAIGLSFARDRPWRIRFSGLLRFAGFFIWQSFQGGLDVARRAFHPRLPLNPALVHYRLGLPEGAPRILLAYTASLLPGTLSTQLEESTLTLHVLDNDPSVMELLQSLERHVANLFVIPSPEEVTA
jgi:multicomponent Na+:H+ antiporter subunit E